MIVIDTIAGNGVLGTAGDNGPATQAEFHQPTDVGFDRIGNIYIADTSNHRIRKIDSSGIIKTIAGSVYGYNGDGIPATQARIRGNPNFT